MKNKPEPSLSEIKEFCELIKEYQELNKKLEEFRKKYKHNSIMK